MPNPVPDCCGPEIQGLPQDATLGCTFLLMSWPSCCRAVAPALESKLAGPGRARLFRTIWSHMLVQGQPKCRVWGSATALVGRQRCSRPGGSCPLCVSILESVHCLLLPEAMFAAHWMSFCKLSPDREPVPIPGWFALSSSCGCRDLCCWAHDLRTAW